MLDDDDVTEGDVQSVMTEHRGKYELKVAQGKGDSSAAREAKAKVDRLEAIMAKMAERDSLAVQIDQEVGSLPLLFPLNHCNFWQRDRQHKVSTQELEANVAALNLEIAALLDDDDVTEGDVQSVMTEHRGKYESKVAQGKGDSSAAREAKAKVDRLEAIMAKMAERDSFEAQLGVRYATTTTLSEAPSPPVVGVNVPSSAGDGGSGRVYQVIIDENLRSMRSSVSTCPSMLSSSIPLM